MLVIWCKDTIWANIWRTISCGWQICPWIIRFERECVFAILFWLQVKLSFLHKCCLPVNVWVFVLQTLSKNHLNHLMTNQQYGCAASEDSDQPGHPPSLIRVFAVRMKKGWNLSYPLNMLNAQRRLWNVRDWTCLRPHFPGDKTVFYGLYLTLVFVVTVQSDNIAHIRILMVMHDSFKSITR